MCLKKYAPRLRQVTFGFHERIPITNSLLGAIVIYCTYFVLSLFQVLELIIGNIKCCRTETAISRNEVGPPLMCTKFVNRLYLPWIPQ